MNLCTHLNSNRSLNQGQHIRFWNKKRTIRQIEDANVITPLADRLPTISKSLSFSSPVIRLVGFFSFLTRDITHFITYTQNATERVEEKEQTIKHRFGSAPSARKRVCDTLHSPCICRLSWACILRETSTKTTRNAKFDCLPSLPPSADRPSLGLLSQANRPPLLSVVDWPSVFFWTFLSSSTSGLAGGLAVRPFVWVSHQSRLKDSLTSAHTHPTQRMAT